MKIKPSDLTPYQACRERVRGMKMTAQTMIMSCEDDPFREAVESGDSSLSLNNEAAANYWYTVATFIEEIQAK